MKKILAMAVLVMAASSLAAGQTPETKPAQAKPAGEKVAAPETKPAEAKPAGEKATAPETKPAEAKPAVEKATASSSADQELIKLDQEWGEAGIRGDTAKLELILADDFQGSGPTGVQTKAQNIAEAKSNSANITNATYKADEYTVRWLDKDTAIMFHRAVEKGQNKGTDYTEQHRSIHVWKKVNGQWQVVASQGMPIPQQPAP
jgi:hypothetical protein